MQLVGCLSGVQEVVLWPLEEALSQRNGVLLVLPRSVCGAPLPEDDWHCITLLGDSFASDK